MKLLNRSRKLFLSTAAGIAVLTGVAMAASAPFQEEDASGADNEVVVVLQEEVTPYNVKSPKTAEELLAAMEDENSHFLAQNGALPPEEAEKAIRILRERYPFESIRDRMSFQAGEPDEITVDSESDIFSYQLSSRALALRDLHSDEVNDFINRPGQGFHRRRIISPYDLPVRYGIASIESVPVESSLLGEPLVELAETAINEHGGIDRAGNLSLNEHGMPTTYIANSFHQFSTDGFAGRGSTGYVRSLDEVAGFDAHRIRGLESVGDIRLMTGEQMLELNPEVRGAEISWDVNRIELVSLLLHDEPCVYETDQLPDMEELSGLDAETRTLNAFEMEALERLRAGEEVVHMATHNRIVMLGAIKAGNTCLQCHAVDEGELLGAFSYEFLRTPRVDVDAIRF